MTTRRRFLGKAVAGIAALGVSASAFPSIILPRQNKKLGVALVGLGYYSTDLLAPALQLTENCYLAGVVSGTPSKVEEWKKKFNIPDRNCYNYQNFDTIANNPDIDVVYVVLPPSMHAEYCIRAAKAGKHVWCEKPMAMTVAECQQMINAASSNKVKLSIGYRLQHEPNTQKVMQYAKSRPYGEMKTVKAEAGYFDPRTDHWKQKKKMGGGAMYDMGVYPLNAVRYATGMEPLAVSAVASTDRPAIYTEVEETMAFTLKFPQGITARCRTSFGAGMNELRVECAKGWYELSPFQAYSGIRGSTSDGIQFDARIPNQQAKQMDDDAMAIMENKAVLVPGEEGLKDIRVVEAIYRSAALKGTEVQVS
jgi:glucose-fructose oxidoreductase